MELPAPRWVRFFVPLAVALLSAGEAHAQRIPEVAVWYAAAALLAPFAFILLRYGRSISAPMTVFAVLAAAAWLHKARIPNARWGSALLLSLPTPVLAIALPLLAFASSAYLESRAG